MKKEPVCGVGINDCPGWRSGTKEQQWIYKEWRNMLERCYSSRSLQLHPTYIGCTVCDSWLRLSNFAKDAVRLPGFEKVIEHNFRGMCLDKDLLVHGNKEYSPDTCCWLTKSENVRERNSRCGNPMSDPDVVRRVHSTISSESRKKAGITLGRPVVAISPNGDISEYYGASSASRALGGGSSVRDACAMLYGSHTIKRGKLKGWSFYWKDEYKGGIQ